MQCDLPTYYPPTLSCYQNQSKQKIKVRIAFKYFASAQDENAECPTHMVKAMGCCKETKGLFLVVPTTNL